MRVPSATPLIFIRCSRTRAYLGPENRWHPDLGAARCFTSALDAELHCRSQELTSIELVVLRKGKAPLTIALTLP